VERRKTRSEVAIEERLGALDPASKRYKVLAAIRDFKASWVEVGEHLTEVREREMFREWGFATFEQYCRRELRIKNETANKLTRSFSFLRDHEPGALEASSSRELPPLDVVDLLSQARERAKVTPRDLATIQREVFDGEKAQTRGQVVQRFREIDPDAFRGPPRPKSSDPAADVRRALLLAERLAGLLEEIDGVTRDTVRGVRAAVEELREKFVASRPKEE
jgi:hypothetical protein